MRSFCLAAFAFSIFLCGCESNTASEGKGYFDSLVTSNVIYLTKGKISLSKEAKIGHKEDTITFQPDSIGWSNELDVFRQLDAYQKPAYRDAYEIADGMKDSQSNLAIREFKTTRAVPIPVIRFYYYQQLKNLKKVEAGYHENNTLYSTGRHLVMEFEEKNGKAILTHYTIDGLQQMILSDSVTYHIHSTLKFDIN